MAVTEPALQPAQSLRPARPQQHFHGKFVWFEHVSGDVPRACEFYRALFDWPIEAETFCGQPYHTIKLQGERIGGFRAAAPAVRHQWASYLSVPDVNAAHKAALAAGATSLLAPTDFPPAGRGAAVSDPTGATVYLWHSTTGDRPDYDPAPLGDWYWNELTTPDVARALTFYQHIFGYQLDTMDLGEDGSYHLLKSTDGKLRGGVMALPVPGTPTVWTPYVRVADTDATAMRATELGAQVVALPTDVAGVGRFTVIVDPLGVMVAAMQPVAMG